MVEDVQENGSESSFPWHLGVFDSHCHPTDTMSSIPSLPDMKIRVLTVMATRAQDQKLVADTVEKYGLKSSNPESWTEEEKMIPCFGWHPWFSHQMFYGDEYSGVKSLDEEGKVKHYQNLLQPKQKEMSGEERRVFRSLPDPRPFSEFLQQTKEHLERYPLALIGEVGLDRSFRIPEAWIPEHQKDRDESLTPGGREGRRLSPYRVNLQHQKKLLKAQLQLAGEMQRAVSIHGVQAHGAVFETLKETWKGHERKVPSKKERKQLAKNRERCAEGDGDDLQNTDAGPKPYPPRICLHSYSGNPEAFKQYLDPSIPVEIYASFSTAINLADKLGEDASKEFAEMIRIVPDDKLLVESDLHTAGPRMDAHVEDIVRKLCEIKGWSLEEGVKILGRNWIRFAFGTDG